MNKRQHHLPFCKICTNRAYSNQHGVICNLTGEIADFERTCSNFKLDETEFGKIKKALEVDINYNYSTTRFDHFFTDKRFTRQDGVQKNFFASVKETHGLVFKKRSYYTQIIVSLSLIIVISLFGNYYNNFQWNMESDNIVGALIALILLLITLYFKHNEKEESLIIDEFGIIQKEKTLSWSNILGYGILEEDDDVIVVVETITSGVQRMSVKDFGLSSGELIEIIELNSHPFYEQ